MNVEKGLRTAAVAGIILFSGCLETSKPISPTETPLTHAPKTATLTNNTPNTPSTFPNERATAVILVALSGAALAMSVQIWAEMASDALSCISRKRKQ
ncbi:hypothetical protein KKH13_04410 [Patescibacteria group bacterium]|nr:hypothetical protein [Patescibacteria group bacterium]